MTAPAASPWPIGIEDVRRAQARIAGFLPPTPLRRYAELDEAVGAPVLVKHENHQPTNSFKVRNALAALTALVERDPLAARRGIAAATRGNFGQGLAYAGRLLGVPVTVCVPVGNNPEKNRAMRDLGAELVEGGASFDDALAAMALLAQRRGLTVVHSADDREVIAGAATMTVELLAQAEAQGRLPDVLLLAVGGGSQAVGALVVCAAVAPATRVIAVQAAGAPAFHDSWRAGRVLTTATADTIADGVATRTAYALTFPALRAGLADVDLVDEAAIAAAIRLALRSTHTLVEGAGALGLAAACARR